MNEIAKSEEPRAKSLSKGPGLLSDRLNTREYALAMFAAQVTRVRELMTRARHSVASGPFLREWARTEAAMAREYLHDYHMACSLESGVAA